MKKINNKNVIADHLSVVSCCTRVAGIAKKEVIQSNTIADHLSVVSGCTRGSGIAKKEVMQFNTSIAYFRALIHLLIFVLKTIQQLKNKKLRCHI